MSALHCHLDPVGGIAGDMFCAAMLAAFPALADPMQQDLADAGVLEHVLVETSQTKVNGVSATHLAVVARGHPQRASGRYAQIRERLRDSALAPGVCNVAVGIFDLLAQAEASVHDVPVGQVHFHEVADWDSIADIVGAASLIVRSTVRSWSCASLPLGGGTVQTEHGLLPVPAPATALLLAGMTMHDDGQPGERVTPTGAAILRYLLAPGQPQSVALPSGRLEVSGIGAGTKRFDRIPNILRALLITPDANEQAGQDSVVMIGFEIDDMTPEELAISLEQIRNGDGVLDASFQMRLGKKGRPQFAVQVIARPASRDEVIRLCLTETSTLGVRVAEQQRWILRREAATVQHDGQKVPVKRAWRPDGGVTVKTEADALRQTPGLAARRRLSGAGDDD